MRRLVRVLVVALCCLVLSLPALAKETQGGKAGSQGKGKGQKKAAQTHGRSTQKGSVKKANKGQKKKTQSTKKTAGKSRSSQTKKGAPKSTRKGPSTSGESGKNMD